MKVLGAILGVILLILISIGIISGLYWVALWSFGVQSFFAWKQILGVLIIIGLLNSGCINKD